MTTFEALPRRASFLRTILLLVSCLALVACGSGGGGDDDGAPRPTATPVATPGSISGLLIVPPDQMLEVEPNDDPENAQRMPQNATIAGSAAFGDSGFRLAGFPDITLEDVFRLNAAGVVRVKLTIGANDLLSNDLDLVLLDQEGRLIDFSEGLISTEVVRVPAPGSYFLGVRAFDGASSYTLAAVDSSPSARPPQRFVPGEVLVKMVPEKLADVAGRASLARAHGLSNGEALPPGVEKLSLSLPPAVASAAQRKIDPAAARKAALSALTVETVRSLSEDPRVEYAEPNYLYYPSLLPNDEFFDLQWHYALINLPEAWDRTVGSDEVVVAVLDTGVVDHPDLRDRLSGGYDFISSRGNANDGDRIDPDPTDPGDDPRQESSSFHGTHVAGTVGATTVNGDGVAGVTWATRIMPLRVLGTEGGSNSDIAQAIRYAAGLSNASDTVPDSIARVINMSLGGEDFSRTIQDAVNAAREAGAIVVAAAGNENSGKPSYPAAMDGVISVAAVDATSARAPYSNFGDTIDVAAPGGNARLDTNGDDFADGVLSTLANDNGEFSFVFLQGTSMASPHVAGVVALMLAANPDLTPDDLDLLIEGAHPETSRRITRDLGLQGRDDQFGHGLIDAAAAVAAAVEVRGGAVLEGSLLRLSVTSLDFDTFLRTLTFEATNPGSDSLEILSVESAAPWIRLEPASGVAPLVVTVRVDREGLPEGVSTGSIRVVSDATQGEVEALVEVSVTVGEQVSGNVGEVFVLALDEESLDPVVQTSTSLERDYAYEISPLAPGRYIVVAGTDRDADELICDIEDACGFFAGTLVVAAGEPVTGIDFVLDELLDPQSLRSPASARPMGPIELLR